MSAKWFSNLDNIPDKAHEKKPKENVLRKCFFKLSREENIENGDENNGKLKLYRIMFLKLFIILFVHLLLQNVSN